MAGQLLKTAEELPWSFRGASAEDDLQPQPVWRWELSETAFIPNLAPIVDVLALEDVAEARHEATRFKGSGEAALKETQLLMLCGAEPTASIRRCYVAMELQATFHGGSSASPAREFIGGLFHVGSVMRNAFDDG
eukprot:gene2200-2910_t